MQSVPYRLSTELVLRSRNNLTRKLSFPFRLLIAVVRRPFHVGFVSIFVCISSNFIQYSSSSASLILASAAVFSLGVLKYVNTHVTAPFITTRFLFNSLWSSILLEIKFEDKEGIICNPFTLYSALCCVDRLCKRSFACSFFLELRIVERAIPRYEKEMPCASCRTMPRGETEKEIDVCRSQTSISKSRNALRSSHM